MLVSDPQGNVEVVYGGTGSWNSSSRGSWAADVQSTAEIGGNTDSINISARIKAPSKVPPPQSRSAAPAMTHSCSTSAKARKRSTTSIRKRLDQLSHFANIHNVQELAAAITPDAHDNAVLELGHGDSITIPGVSATFLQQNLQSLVHLHA